MLQRETDVINIVINGEARTVPSGLSIATLLVELGVSADRVAVELDTRIVRQPLWVDTPVDAGAQVEIVQFVGGG